MPFLVALQRLLFAGTLAWSLAACTTESVSSDAGPRAVLEDACSRWATKTCRKLTECGESEAFDHCFPREWLACMEDAAVRCSTDASYAYAADVIDWCTRGLDAVHCRDYCPAGPPGTRGCGGSCSYSCP